MKANRKRVISPPGPKRTPAVKPSPAQKALSATQRPRRQESAAGAPSKQDRVIAMLRQTQGTTVAAVMKATGWQKHSVHGFLAGVVRKKLGLPLHSQKTDGQRVYRIADGKTSKCQAKASRKRTG